MFINYRVINAGRSLARAERIKRKSGKSRHGRV